MIKKPIKKLISILVCVLVLYCCKSNSQDCRLKSTFQKTELNVSTQKLLDIYLESLKELNPKEFLLRIGIHQYSEIHYMILLSNFYKNQDGFEKGYEKKWKVGEYKGFRIYVQDSKNQISTELNEQIDIHYPKPKDSIVPDGYEGNLWELHFRKDTLAEMHLMFTPEVISKKAEKEIKQIDFK